MKYFKNISSVNELKKEYRILAIKNHPDKGRDTEIMQDINAEFDVLFAILKEKVIESATNSEPTETAQEYRRDFYTANGWEGARYNSKLSIKEVAARVKYYAKQRWPKFKFSVRTQYYSGGASIHLTLLSGPVTAIIGDREYISTCGDLKGYENEISNEVYNVVNDVCDYMRSYNYDNSDVMTDYFSVNFYTDINIGRWDKPYQIKNENVVIAKKDKINTSTDDKKIFCEVVEYSEKSIAVFGDTRKIKDELKKIGGKFNSRLTYKENISCGWIFPKGKINQIEKVLSEYSLNEISGKDEKLDERIIINPSAFMAFVSCLQKRIVKTNVQEARKYVKEYIKSYKLQIMQLRYIIYLMSDAQQRLG